MTSNLSMAIRTKAVELGYEKCGIIKVSAMQRYGEKLREHIKRVPEAAPAYQRFFDFADPSKNYEWAKSIVVCVRRYGKYKIPDHLRGLIAKYYLVDSRRDEKSPDYQNSILFEKYLNNQGLHTATTRDFGITALRWAALEAGLGTIRRNNFFYTESGSWCYLEAWLIDREMELIDKTTLKECPENCNLCRKHCPTSSLSEPYTTNMLTCVSYLTTLGGWDLQNETLSKAMGGWVFGCDACQDVCPFNQGTWTDEEDFPGLQDLSNSISLEKIINMDYQFLQESMQPKFWYIAKDNVWKWKVNALNCMRNTYRNSYDRYIEIACNDENEHVREMAEWVQSTKAL